MGFVPNEQPNSDHHYLSQSAKMPAADHATRNVSPLNFHKTQFGNKKITRARRREWDEGVNEKSIEERHDEAVEDPEESKPAGC